MRRGVRGVRTCKAAARAVAANETVRCGSTAGRLIISVGGPSVWGGRAESVEGVRRKCVGGWPEVNFRHSFHKSPQLFPLILSDILVYCPGVGALPALRRRFQRRLCGGGEAVGALRRPRRTVRFGAAAPTLHGEAGGHFAIPAQACKITKIPTISLSVVISSWPTPDLCSSV